jgi:competence protein ComEA
MEKLLFVLFACLLGFTVPALAAEKDGKAKPAAAQKADKLIDINTAKVEDLMTLDGIGEVRAKAIIKGRPYTRKDELVDKNVLTEGVYDKIKDQIIAHQLKKK